MLSIFAKTIRNYSACMSAVAQKVMAIHQGNSRTQDTVQNPIIFTLDTAVDRSIRSSSIMFFNLKALKQMFLSRLVLWLPVHWTDLMFAYSLMGKLLQARRLPWKGLQKTEASIIEHSMSYFESGTSARRLGILTVP